MSFKDFTLLDIVQKLHLSFRERSLFPDAAERAPSAWLSETLAETTPLALTLGNEKARSELLIAPVLVEVRRVLHHRVSLFSGVELAVDEARGLTGVCDFVLSRSPEQLLLRAPVVAIVAAKQENIKGGIGQCAAEMVAARLFNEREGQTIGTIYGAVTTGSEWRFLALEGEILTADVDTYLLLQIGQILGILIKMLEA